SPLEQADPSCLALEVDAAGRVETVVPDPGIATRTELTRGRVAVGAADAALRASLRTTAVRSTGDDGYLGIHGEASVPGVDAAEAGLVSGELLGGSPGLRLHGELGILPDLWVEGADRAWGLPGTLADLGIAAGWMERADLGARLGAVSP